MYKKIISLILAVCLIGAPLVAQGTVQATSQEEELKAGKTQLENELQAVREEVAALEERNSSLQSQLSDLQSEGKAMQEEYDELTDQMNRATEYMEEAIAASQAAVDNVAAQQAAYEDRIVNLFQYRNKSVLEVLLESDSIEGFYTNMRLMEYVAEADNQLLENLMTAQEDAVEKQAEAERRVEEYSVFMDNKQDQINKLEDGISLVEQDIEINEQELVVGSEVAEDLEIRILEVDEQLAAFYAEQRRLKEEAEASQRASRSKFLEESAEASRKASEAESIQSRNASIIAASKSQQEEQERRSREAAEAASRAIELSKLAEESRAEEEESIKVSISEEASIASSIAEEKEKEVTETTTALPETEETITTEAPPTEAPTPSRGGLLNPLASYQYISSPYGPRVHPITGDPNGFHWGVDFSAAFGTPVRAAKSGTVIIANAPYQGQNYTSHKSGYGNYITIDHGDGTSTTYAHLKYVDVSKGQYVDVGQYIGQVGSTGASTGAHLHFEYAIYGETVDPIKYID